jgi:L-alanine-DL-glutamate epimerase-like enolase superfamily enzyme
MKIKDVQLQVVKWDLPDWNTQSDIDIKTGTKELGVLRIITDEGVEGNAFLANSSRGTRIYFEGLMNEAKPELVGRNAEDREWIWNRLWRMSEHMVIRSPAIAAVDVALWDLSGKIAGMPIYHMMGAQRHKAPIYASSAVFDNAEAYVDEVLSFKERGINAYKLHVGGKTPKATIAACHATRQAVGEDYALMLDCSRLYTFPEALQIGRALDELGFHWYEDPMRAYYMQHMAELTRRLDTPIAISDANEFRFQEAASYLAYGVGDILRSDCWKDGITGVKKLAVMCEGFGKNCEVHTSTTATGNVAALQIVLSIKNCDYYEYLLQGAPVYKFGINEELKVDNEGFAHAPSGPGLGVTLDWDLLDKLKLEVLT